jgi:DNA-binding NtrC family response regulator
MEKVLFVDDEEDIEFLAKQKFRKQISTGAFKLLFSQNGEDALALVQQDPHIAVVIVDLNMPGMDGFTLLDKLKEVNPTLKTIIVSAYSDMKTFRRAMNKGAYDFITKPVDFADLENVMIRVLELYRESLQVNP